MARFGPKLEKEQLILGNFVDIGVDLFVMSTTLSYADHLLGENPADQSRRRNWRTSSAVRRGGASRRTSVR